MEFKILLSGAEPDMASLHAAIVALDPSALFVREPLGEYLHLLAKLSLHEVQAATARAGWAAPEGQIQPQRSECCGGCSG